MSVEDIKKQSRRLRGSIDETLQTESTSFSEDDYQLLKFHGTYQQDNRDKRVELRKEGKERAYMMMVRSRIPGGHLTAEQYLIHDRVSEIFGQSNLRITSRQGLQLHYILKKDLKGTIQAINESGITTWGACGDVVRNVMASPVPMNSPAHLDMQKLAAELKDTFSASSRAYSEIWLDDEKMETPGSEDEPIYGELYLPRKFKIGIAVPPRNDVDVYTQDIGLVPHVEGDTVAGYTVIVGGGFGMSHGKKHTHPCLGQPMAYVTREHVIDVCKAIVLVQRDNGNREDRKQARMKYLIEKKGLEWFTAEVKSRVSDSVVFDEPKTIAWETTGDPLGWNEQGDGNLFSGLWVPEGRIEDHAEIKYKSAIKAIAERLNLPIRLTPNCNILFYDIKPAQKAEFEAILNEFAVPYDDNLTEARRLGMACVALPTCGLALAESERVFQELLDDIDVHLKELNLQDEKILFRMTGCPNGCARPYNADFAFVGKSPGKYVFFVGGSHRGDRLVGLEKKMVSFDAIPGMVREYLDDFVANRSNGESFSDYWARTKRNGAAPVAEQFHDEGWHQVS